MGANTSAEIHAPTGETDFLVRSRRSAASWAVVLTLLFAVSMFFPARLFFSDPAGYLPVHAALEMFSMAISVMVFVLAWGQGEGKPGHNSQIVLLGAGFLGVALIDLAHTLSYAGMPQLITPSGPEKAINFWLAARLFAALLLLAVATLPARRWSRPAVHFATAGSLVLAGLVWWVGLSFSDVIPRTYVEGHGLTNFKVGVEYGLVGLFAFASVSLALRCRRDGRPDLHWLAVAAWVQALAEIYFTRYLDVSDSFNLLGHVFKTLAYLMVYRAIFMAEVRAPLIRLDQEHAGLRALLDGLPQLVWLKDQDGRYLACNRPFEKLVGLPEFKLIGRTDDDLVSPDQAQQYRAEDEAAVRVGHALTHEEAVVFRADGHRAILETTKSPIRLSDGSLLGILGVGHDITERKRAEALFHGVFDQSSLLSAVLDDKGMVVHINETALALITEKREAVLGRYFPQTPWWDCEEDRRKLVAAMESAYRGDSATFEASHPRLEGKSGRFHVLVNLKAIDMGERQYLSVTGMDVSQLKEVESALHDSQNVLSIAQSVARMGHYRIDLSTMSWTNDDLFDEIYGIDENFVRDYSHLTAIIHPQDRDVLAAFAKAHLTSKSTPHIEYRIIRPSDGALRWVAAWGMNFFNGRDEPVLRIGAVQDITERKLAETELRQRNEELERFNRAAVGREIDMIQLKRQVNHLSARLGLPEPHRLDFAADFGAANQEMSRLIEP